jgi:hypothetical protein
VGCFNFDREEVLIFKLFGRCFKPIGWDGDIRKLRKRLTKVYSFFCSKPTAWDGDGKGDGVREGSETDGN